jgi:addiction module RelE/StbE family toxin
MLIQYLPTFKKQYQKLPSKIQAQFDDRLMLFVEDPTEPRLRVHPLRGQYAGYWSLNVNGDFRALFRKDSDTIIIFALIGTHSQLYG